MNELEIQLGLEKLKQEWEPKGFKCEIYTTNSQEEWSDRGHKNDEFIIMIEGTAEISFSGKTHSPGIGEICKIPATKPHTVKLFADSTVKMYWIYAYDWQWDEDGNNAFKSGKLRYLDVKSS